MEKNQQHYQLFKSFKPEPGKKKDVLIFHINGEAVLWI